MTTRAQPTRGPYNNDPAIAQFWKRDAFDTGTDVLPNKRIKLCPESSDRAIRVEKEGRDEDCAFPQQQHQQQQRPQSQAAADMEVDRKQPQPAAATPPPSPVTAIPEPPRSPSANQSTPHAMRVASLVHDSHTDTPPSRPRPPSLTTIHALPFSQIVDADLDGKPYHCSVTECDKKYKKLNGLIYHFQTAHSTAGLDDPKPFKCVAMGCDKAYRNSNGLAYHIEKGHLAAESTAKETSKDSGKEVSKEDDLDHLSIAVTAPISTPVDSTSDTAIGTSPQPPPTTTKKTSRKTTDPVDKPYMCPYKGCGKAYKNPNGLAYHLSKGKATGHTVLAEPQAAGIKTYNCAVVSCGKSYKSPQGLAEHLQARHADMDPPGLCINTPASAASAAATHPAASPKILECPSCMRPFRSPHSLEYHMTTVHHLNLYAVLAKNRSDQPQQQQQPPHPHPLAQPGRQALMFASDHPVPGQFQHHHQQQQQQHHLRPLLPSPHPRPPPPPGFDDRQPHHPAHYSRYHIYYYHYSCDEKAAAAEDATTKLHSPPSPAALTPPPPPPLLLLNKTSPPPASPPFRGRSH
ncbi:hypothetical protein DFJ77DRAFT_507599 [Powellomyces hirtus]|nr:hypothetical protein DFJ77DRAFT_507599 [Powellomyces hirtus]